MKITLTPADMLKGEPHKEGWVKATISDTVTGPNKNQDGVNYTCTFAIEGDPDNRTIDKIFSSKALGFIKPMLAALAGKSMSQFIEENKSKGLDFDFDALQTGKLQIKIGTRLFDGRPVSEVQDFAPYNTTQNF